MDVIWGILESVNFANVTPDDIPGKISTTYTPYVFALAFGLTSFTSYFGSPITCWTPNEFKRGWIQYTLDYCFVENTYFWDMNNPDMPPEGFREDNEIRYYQWVQFILAGLGIAFMIPRSIWNYFNWVGGLPVEDIVKRAHEHRFAEEGARKKTIKEIAKTLTAFEKRTQGNSTKVTAYYILHKILNIVVVVIELFVFWKLIGFTISEFLGFKILSNSEWKLNGIFPRQTMCDFEVRTKGNIQKYSVQCVLVQNMTNEIVFVFIFYYLLLVLLIALYSIISLIGFLSHRKNFIRDRTSVSRKFITNSLEKQASQENAKNEKKDHFDEDAPLIAQPAKLHNISADTAVVLRLIEQNAGKNMSSDIISELME